MSVLPSSGIVDFLRKVYPAGPWALSAIAVDRKGIETQTFAPGEEERLVRWLEFWNKKANLYWHVNPVLKAVSKKAQREDIREVCYLHVDVDPREGVDLKAERDRILTRLRAGVPEPSFIVFSGGGYQAFWKLREPIPINGDLARAEDAKRYNMQLERVFGGDNCHNIDRLCRLPGTMNVPDAKKLKKGRVAALAEVVEFHEDRVYDLGRFAPATDLQLPGERGFSGDNVKLSGNIARLGSVEDLNAYGVPDRTKVIIVQGCLPDEPKPGDNSRSAWLFDALCSMVRCSVPDDVVYSVVTDPDFLISSSVVDKGDACERYAVRQISRAKEEAIDPWLRKLNERHAVIGNLGGKCRIVEEVQDAALGRPRLTRQSFEDFCNRYLNQYVTVGKDKEGKDSLCPAGKWWLRHPQRKQYDTLVFAPGRELPGTYNLWKGFAVAAKPGDCELFLTHVRENICGDNAEYYTYLMGWLARAVQNPDSPGQTAIVLRGRQGTGKSFFVKTFGNLFGRHFMQVADPKHLVGSFNAHLRDTVVLFGDEAFYAGDKKHESVLKMLITEEVITVEAKGVDAEAAPNYVHVLLASNNHWVVPAGQDERRFFVLDVADGAKQNSEYFGRIKAQLDTGGREALLHFLMNYDLSGYEVRTVPKTKALAEQKILSLAPEEEWWYRKLEEGRLLGEHREWVREVVKSQLVEDYVEYMRRFNVQRRSNETVLGRFLRRMMPGLGSFQKNAKFKVPVGAEGWTKEVNRRAYFFSLPTLAACRKTWSDLYGTGDFDAPAELPAEPDFEEIV
jgi:hypothetical protein